MSCGQYCLSQQMNQLHLVPCDTLENPGPVRVNVIQNKNEAVDAESQGWFPLYGGRRGRRRVKFSRKSSRSSRSGKKCCPCEEGEEGEEGEDGEYGDEEYGDGEYGGYGEYGDGEYDDEEGGNYDDEEGEEGDEDYEGGGYGGRMRDDEAEGEWVTSSNWRRGWNKNWNSRWYRRHRGHKNCYCTCAGDVDKTIIEEKMVDGMLVKKKIQIRSDGSRKVTIIRQADDDAEEEETEEEGMTEDEEEDEEAMEQASASKSSSSKSSKKSSSSKSSSSKSSSSKSSSRKSSSSKSSSSKSSSYKVKIGDKTISGSFQMGGSGAAPAPTINGHKMYCFDRGDGYYQCYPEKDPEPNSEASAHCYREKNGAIACYSQPKEMTPIFVAKPMPNPPPDPASCPRYLLVPKLIQN